MFAAPRPVNVIPDIGVSDEEPAVLVAAGAASGDISKLTSEPLNVVTFGTPVTLGLYHALQDAQIASGKLAGSCKARRSTPATPKATATARPACPR